MVQIDEAALDRYRALAERRPRWYRTQVALLAVIGDASLTVAQILPIVLPIAIGTLLFPHPWLIAMALVASVFLVWMTRPQLRTSGRRLARSEAPTLFDAVESMCERLDVPRNIEIRIDDEFNATAGEGRGLFGLLGTRRVMTLGMPFLACMSKTDVLAVVAHELGHFSRRHGRLGNWLYRARVGWSDYAQRGDQAVSALERAAGWYAKGFAPRFLTLSLLHSRACEYEADRDASSLVGAPRFAAALTRVAVVAEAGWPALEAIIERWRQEMRDPPKDFYTRLHVQIETLIRDHRSAWIERVCAVASGWHDTHPSLADRLHAIGMQPAVEPVTVNAGTALLGEHWPRIAAEFDAKWFADEAPAWRLTHLAYRTFWSALLLQREQGLEMNLSARLLVARILRRFDAAAGMAELEVLHRRDPRDPGVCFALGAARLSENRSDGVELMRAVAESDASYSEAAYARLRAYAERVADNAGVRRWGRRWQAASSAMEAAAATALDAVRAGNGEPCRLDQRVVDSMREIATGDPSIAGVWVASVGAPIADGRGLAGHLLAHVLVLRLHTEVLRAAGDDEETLRERYQALIASFVPGNEAVFALSYLTTESMPPFVERCTSIVEAQGAAAEVQPA